MTRHLVELPINFEGGTGMTQIVSQQEVVFTTNARLTAGDSLTGQLPFPGEDGLPGMALNFRASVLLVAAPMDQELVREVHARFDELEIARIEDR
jgi:hypothetical protein